MIQAYLYHPIYLIIVIIGTVIVTKRYYGQLIFDDGVSCSSKYQSYLMPLIIALFIGFRPVSGIYFVDMANYDVIYYALHYGKAFNFDINAENFLFDNLFNLFGSQYYDIRLFFVVISLIYFLFTYKALTRLFGPYSFLAFIVFLGAFSTFSYATNGIKAGAAASFFLCALGYRDKPKLAGLFLIISIGFHHSMIMPVCAYIIAYLYKNTRVYLAFWIFALIIAVLHITYFQDLFSSYADDTGVKYLSDTSGDWGGKSGFRWDFVLYSALPIYIGYVAVVKYGLKSNTYAFLLNVYLLTNAIWMLCMYAAFTNRIAYLSWLMYPVVTIYPFFCPTFMPEQTLRLKQVIWFQLLFTLFMNVIYYD
ncbi:MAG: EpsG family protein [Muribaculaceae bacterium]|nr:EpsG family protein [Muribaculaceae bacterium]